MSWLDRVNNIKLKIKTGEGSEFSPLWVGASRERDPNASKFNFTDVEGALVRRGKVSAFEYPVQLHFTGEDCIDEANRFEVASRDNRPWTLVHPYYGAILVQPVTFRQGNSKLNDSVFTIKLVETIQDTSPTSIVEVQAKVLEAVDIAAESLTVDFQDIGDPEPGFLASVVNTINEIGDILKLEAITDIDLQAVQNDLNKVVASVNNIGSDAVTFMNDVTELARTPAKFYTSVQDRIRIIEKAYETLKDNTIGLLTVQTKKFFEAMGGMFTSAKAEAAVIQTQEIADEQGIEDNLIVDYLTRVEVILTADLINDGKDDYINTLGSLQSEIDATPESYTPKTLGVNAVKDSTVKATGQLLQIAVNTKQERLYTVPETTNLISLIHRLLGKVDNETMITFAESNNILLDEWLQVQKGRILIYYI